ncbi:OmpH family outer membrane protein [Pseudomonas kitaguniensis]|uniref:OmpH family outer membrane protein n=1 Tax=Pseudomonas kitaguniensis TaxID=2607908 RepID=UPI0031345B31
MGSAGNCAGNHTGLRRNENRRSELSDGPAGVRCGQALRSGRREKIRPTTDQAEDSGKQRQGYPGSSGRAATNMQQGERERLELEFKQKARDYQFQSKELNEAKAVADREMLKQLKPKLDSAVEEVIKKGAFDLVFERGAVIDVKPQYDITRQVIERMNQLK